MDFFQRLLEYDYILRAFGAGIAVALTLPLIGMIVSLKRLSMIGDALSHTSLAGVALGLMLGFNPVVGAVGVCIIAALTIEGVRRKLKRYSEMAIAIIMSTGIGLAAVLMNFLNSPANFNSFLFGSIGAISVADFWVIAGLCALVASLFIVLYPQLFYVAFDETGARLNGINVKAVNFVFTVMTAVIVSVASKIVGALVVSSLMILPVACAMQFNKGFRVTLVISCAFALFFMVMGLLISSFAEIAPSGAVVLLAVAVFLIIIAVKAIKGKIQKARASKEEEERQRL